MQVQVTGDTLILEKLMAIDIAVPIDGVDTDIEKQINLDEYIEEHYENTGLKIVDQNKTMGIKIPVIKMAETSLDIKPENVTLRETDPKYKYTTTSSWLSKVLVRGKEEDLANVEVSDFDFYIDVTGYVSGSYQLSIESDYTGNLYIEPGKMNVVIEEVISDTEVTGESIQ